ncbi:lipid II flippase MurJ [Desulfovibrio piger]
MSLSHGNAPRPSGGARMARTAGMLALFTLLSRLLGLVRDMGMAWMVGCGPVADALVAALRLPHLLRRLLGEGSLSMTLTAWLVRHDVAQGQGDPLPALASGLFRRLVLVLGGLVLLGMLAAPQLLAFLAPALSPEALAEGSSLLRLCLPYVLLAGMAALGMAVLHCREVFWLPALSPVIFNVVVISAMLAGWLAGGTEAVPAALAAGMSAGGLAQWLAQWGYARHVFPATAMESPAAAPQLVMLAAMGLAVGSQIAGLYYAERLLELPLGLIGACLGMASLPRLSRLAGEKDFAAFRRDMALALRWATLLSLPAAAGLWAVGPCLVDVLLHHGEFDATGVRQVTLALWAYLPCLPACAVSRCLLAGCNALGDVRLTALSSLLAVVFTLAGGAWLLHSMARDIYFCLPAAAASAALWGQTVWLWRGLRRRLRPLLPAPALLDGMACLRHVLAAGAAAAGALVVLRLCGMVCPLQELLSVVPVLLPGLPAMAGLALSIGAGCCAWGSALVLLGDADTRMLAHKLRTKLQGDSRS